MDNIPSDNIEKEETRETNRTSELVTESINIDPVTGYPFETPMVRQKLLEVLNDAIGEHRTAVFIDADIDNLKGLNDKFGHKNTNLGIRTLIQDKEQEILKLSFVDTFLLYRPQAGGDEFKALLVLKKDNEDNSVTGSLSSIIEKPSKFQPRGNGESEIRCSYGISVHQCVGNENPGAVLQNIEAESGENQFLQKSEKIINSLRETLEKGKDLSIADYIKFVSEEWGSRRLSKPVLEAILLSVLEKVKPRSPDIEV